MKDLTLNFANEVIGKIITWEAVGYETEYKGKAIIKDINNTAENPLVVETLSGDDLSFAFVSSYGLDGDKITHPKNLGERVLAFSDNDRSISIITVE